MQNIILGSQSPRRKEILSSAGFQFQVKPLHVNEDYPDSVDVQKVPIYLALKKASAYEPLDGEVLVTCDTVVILENEILEKPKDFDEAFRMLKRLSGKMHTVISGVCIKRNGFIKTISDSTEVKFQDLSNQELNHYIKNFSPYDKAGAYGIQEWIGIIGVEYIRGSFYNVMGLPINRFYKELQ